jgi:predicted O-methyltransferase YrrM
MISSLQLINRLTPDSGAKSAAHRLAMLRAFAGARLGRDRTSRAVARALRTTSLNRIPADERAWIDRIEAWRKELADSAARPDLAELGVHDVRAAVKWMSVPPLLGRFLMRLVRELEPRSCLELGTGFGFSGAYQAAALELNRAGRLVSVDVSNLWAGIAREGFSGLGIERVEVRVGEASETLSGAIRSCAPVDYVFIDSDHQEAAMLETLETLLPNLSAGSVVVFDDVGFSIPEMERAWRKIAAHPGVAHSLRFGRMGVAVVNGSPDRKSPALR